MKEIIRVCICSIDEAFDDGWAIIPAYNGDRERRDG